MGRNHTSGSRWSRRAFLASLIAPSSYLLYRVAAHNQWIVVTRGGRPFSAGIEPRRKTGKQQFSMLIVGDTGKDTFRRTSVVRAMRKHIVWSQPDAVMLLGDNFYETGVDSVDDPRFRDHFESLFDARSFDMPFYACLGNHDVYGNADAQVQYSDRSDRWRMPAKYYRERKMAGVATVDFVVLDTNQLLIDDQESVEQLAWLRSELAGSDADYKIIAGHHPALTGGQHEIVPRIGEVLPPLFNEFQIDLYLSGHDHDLQLLKSDSGWLQVVSGSGSKLRSTSWIDETMFAKADAGFCWLLIDENGLSLSYYNATDRLFTHTVPKVRKSEPLGLASNY